MDVLVSLFVVLVLKFSPQSAAGNLPLIPLICAEFHPRKSARSAGNPINPINPIQSAVGSRQSAVGSRQSAVGSPQSAVRSRQAAVGSRQSAVGSPQSAVRNQPNQPILSINQKSISKDLKIHSTN
jgi:hypothetical protein